ncbi:uncharacterized protein LOC125369523 [Ricinus communis]|uniref:uncharacterized protein LOC125369523 n=1 Tax=Ricinus communis TaxID=3988 RepID=UPI00201A9D42|nr:uncharacterized protein LOC125369523 [Ricinus communis]
MKIVIVGERKIIPNFLILAVTACQLVKDGCEAYLISFVDTTEVSPGVSDVPVCEDSYLQKMKRRVEEGKNTQFVLRDDGVLLNGNHIGILDLLLVSRRVCRKRMMEFAYNNNFHSSIGMAPYEALYDKKCRILEFDDLFLEEIPNGLPSIRGIEHQINFIPGSSIPHRSAYRSNPEKTKELQSTNGIEADEEKVKAIKGLPKPTYIGNVRSFHGLASFYRRFMKDFSSLAMPLAEVECDASIIGIGAVLMQEGHHLKGQNKLNRRYAKWSKFIESFPYVIKYKQGKDNVVEDALSQRHDGYFFMKKCLCVPIWSMHELLVRQAHGGRLIGHFGIAKTYGYAKSKVKPYGLYTPLPIPTTLYIDISMDIVLGLPRSRSGKDSIYVVFDRFSKMAHFVPCHQINDASHTTDLFFKEMLCLYGMPRTIVSDRDAKFLSYFSKALWCKLGTNLFYSTTYHPQTDGQMEVVNRSFSTLLRTIIKKNLKTWEEIYMHGEFAYNKSVYSTTKYLPFEAKYVKQLHDKVWINIEKRTKQYVTQPNKGQKEVIFEPEDWVWVHMLEERFPAQRHSKLLPREDGPVQVVERINDNTYKLDLPCEYNVSATLSIADLTLFDIVSDVRTNPFKERGMMRP